MRWILITEARIAGGGCFAGSRATRQAGQGTRFRVNVAGGDIWAAGRMALMGIGEDMIVLSRVKKLPILKVCFQVVDLCNPWCRRLIWISKEA